MPFVETIKPTGLNLDALNSEKLALEQQVEEIDTATRLFVTVMREKKEAVLNRLLEIDSLLVPKTATLLQSTEAKKLSRLEKKLLEVLDGSNSEAPYMTEDIINNLFEEELSQSPEKKVACRTRLYTLIPRLQEKLSLAGGVQVESKRIKDTKFKGYYLTSPIAIVQPEESVIEPEENHDEAEKQDVEEQVPDFALEIINDKKVNLLCPDGQCILVRGDSRVSFLKVLVDRTNDDNPITEEELKALVHGEKVMSNSHTSVTLHGLKSTLNPYGWTIDGIKQSHSDPIRYFINDIPMKGFEKGKSRGFMVDNGVRSYNLA